MTGTANGQQFRAVRQPRMRDGVVGQLVDAIVRGDLPPGAKLPTEAELILSFGVSRTVVREALKVLEEKGLIEVQHGRGALVRPRDRWNALDPEVLAAQMGGEEARRLFDELTRVRIALEGELAEQAAKQVTPEQLAAMERLLLRMRGLLGSPDDYLAADVAFHELVGEAAGNRIAQAIMGSIHEPLIQSRRITNRIPGGVEKAHEFHEAIFDRLQRRDPAGAREAMRDHLLWSWRAWQPVLAGAALDQPSPIAEG